MGMLDDFMYRSMLNDDAIDAERKEKIDRTISVIWGYESEEGFDYNDCEEYGWREVVNSAIQRLSDSLDSPLTENEYQYIADKVELNLNFVDDEQY